MTERAQARAEWEMGPPPEDDPTPPTLRDPGAPPDELASAIQAELDAAQSDLDALRTHQRALELLHQADDLPLEALMDLSRAHGTELTVLHRADLIEHDLLAPNAARRTELGDLLIKALHYFFRTRSPSNV